MSKKLLLLLIMIMAVSLIAFACAPAAETEQPAETETPGETEDPAPTFDGEILIGLLIPLTGSEGTYGVDMQNSYQMAADEINEAGGVLGKKIVLTAEDDACDPNQAATAGAKLLSSTPLVITGGYCSGATIPALGAFNDAKIPFLSSAANSMEIPKLGLPQTYLVNSTGNMQIDKSLELYAKLGTKKLAIIHQGDAYTQNLSEISDEKVPPTGIEIVSHSIMPKGEQDISAIVTQIKSSGADTVLWCGYYADGGLVIKQLRQGGFTGPILCGDGSSDTQLIEIAGPAGEEADGTYLLSPPYVEFSAKGPDYIAKYEGKYGQKPGPYSTLCYDTMYVIAEAIERAGSLEFEAINKEIAATPGYEGMSGLIKFTEDDHTLVDSNFIVLKIEGGKFALVEL